MADDPDIPNVPKKEWHDGIERVCWGAIVEYKEAGRHYSRPLRVHETPREVHNLMLATESGAMLELHHHSDPTAPVYIRNESVVSIDVLWQTIEDE